MWDLFMQLVRSAENVLITGSQNGEPAVNWAAVIFAGIFFAAIGIGIGYFFWKAGDTLDKIGEGWIYLTQAGGTGFVNVTDGVKAVGVGIGNAIATPHTLVMKAAEVRIAAISAARQFFKFGVENKEGEKVSLELSGDGAFDVAPQVMESSRGSTAQVLPGYRRLISQKPRQEGNSE